MKLMDNYKSYLVDIQKLCSGTYNKAYNKDMFRSVRYDAEKVLFLCTIYKRDKTFPKMSFLHCVTRNHTHNHTNFMSMNRISEILRFFLTRPGPNGVFSLPLGALATLFSADALLIPLSLEA